MTPPIYLIGYSGMTAARLFNIVEGSGGVLVDIRMSARSRVPQWSKGRLVEVFGDRYIHLPSLGNALYQSGGMQIADYGKGKDAIEIMLETLEKPVILMCACKSPAECHRTKIGEMLRGDGFAVEEITPALIKEFVAQGQDAKPYNLQLSLFSGNSDSAEAQARQIAISRLQTKGAKQR